MSTCNNIKNMIKLKQICRCIMKGRGNMKRRQEKNDKDRLQRLIRRNWILAAASLALALAFYFIFK